MTRLPELQKKALAAIVLACLAAGIQAQSGTDERQLEWGTVRDDSPASGSGEITVVLKLADDPVAVVRSRRPGRLMRSGERDAIAQDLRRKQEALLPAIEARGARVMTRMQHAINGIKVRGTPGQIAALARLPGVIGVKPVLIHRLENATSVPFIGAPAVWDGVAGFRGEHIRVAVIDTGIDYTHANFGGPGTTAAFQLAASGSTSAANPALFGPAAAKVKGGTDLVGDNYDAGSSDPVKQTPVPDANPLDCAGHGSHVAGTIGGFGVRADGSTFHGPYDATTSAQAFTIGPGVAPMADLYAVRVFGCSGSTNAVAEAIDWAIANDMQVINMSLGSSFGASDSADAEASTNAANAGIVVVTSAGNSGFVPYIVGSPAAGDKVIAVAAMDAKSPQTFPAANAFLAPSGQTIVLLAANGAALTSGTSLNVVVLRNANGTVSLGCNESEYVDATIAGKLVVTQRGTCARIDRATFGQRHGAAAVAMINNASGYSQFEDVIPGVTIPFFSVRGTPATDGATLALSTAATVTTGAPFTDAAYHAFASFSSMGPRNRDAHLKPDVTGPGVNIFSTAVGSGNGGILMSGTSMAAPHVAGVAALALQAHENWDPDDVRLAIVNTADPSQIAGYVPRVGGAGLVQPLRAALTSVIAEGNDGAPNLSFGFVEFTSDFHAGGDITVRNLGLAAANFNVAATPVASTSSAHTVGVTPSMLSLQPGQAGTLHVDLGIFAPTSGDASAFREVSGLVTLTPAQPTDNNGVSLNVPYHAVPRARAMVSTTIPDGFGPSSPSSTATVTNNSSSVGGAPDLYAWGLTGQHPEKGFYGIRAVGAQAFNNPSGRMLQFAVNTYAPWTQLFGEFDIFIDSDGDGISDYVVFAGRGTFASSPIDRAIALVLNLHTGARTTSGFFVSYQTNQSTLLIPVLASAVGVTGRFTYTVQTFDGVGNSDASTGLGHFNGFSSAITTGAFSTIGPGNFTNVPLSIDPVEWPLTPALGLMIVSRDNVSGSSQAQLMAVPTAAVSTLLSIAITPPSSSIGLGETQQLKAIGQYADGNSKDLTGTVTWASSSAAVSVNASGMVAGITPGSAALLITATSGSVRGTATVTVARSETTTTRSANLPHSVFGQPMSLTAVVSPAPLRAGTPTGTVTFFDGLAVIGGTAVSLTNSVAVVTTSTLGAGTHSIGAAYNGDKAYTSSSSSPLEYTVTKASTTTSVVSSALSPAAGQPVTFTATVSAVAPGAGTPTGTATFFDGVTSLGTAALSGGSAALTTSVLAAGGRSISVQYNGDSNFIASTSASLAVTVTAPATVTLGATSVGAGAVVTPTIANGPGAVSDWVGLFPVGAANQDYVAWQYLNGLHTKPGVGLTDAVLAFTMPLTLGAYEVRLFRNDSFSLLARSGTVTVAAPTITLDTTSAVSGAVVTATIVNGPGTTADWVGLFPMGGANTAYVAWAYLNGLHTKPAAGLSNAAVPFTLPLTPGTYEVRLFRNDSFTLLAQSGTVTVAAPTITLDTTNAGLGAVVTATVANGPGTTADWVGLFPVGGANTAYLAWAYLNGLHTKPAAGLSNAAVPFTLPLTPGTYDVRLFRNDSFTLLAKSGSVTAP